MKNGFTAKINNREATFEERLMLDMIASAGIAAVDLFGVRIAGEDSENYCIAFGSYRIDNNDMLYGPCYSYYSENGDVITIDDDYTRKKLVEIQTKIYSD